MGGRSGIYESFFVSLGKRVRALRQARGWSLRDMVVLHGYHASQWQVFEKGSNVTLDSVLRMAAVFDLTLTELLGDLAEFPRKYSAQAPDGSAKLASSADIDPGTKSVRRATKKAAGK